MAGKKVEMMAERKAASTAESTAAMMVASSVLM